MLSKNQSTARRRHAPVPRRPPLQMPPHAGLLADTVGGMALLRVAAEVAAAAAPARAAAAAAATAPAAQA